MTTDKPQTFEKALDRLRKEFSVWCPDGSKHVERAIKALIAVHENELAEARDQMAAAVAVYQAELEDLRAKERDKARAELKLSAGSGMTPEEFADLDVGDIVRNAAMRESHWLVTANYGGRATAVQTMDLTNPSEWEMVSKAGRVRREDLGE